jgi:hypothetical protein
MKKQGRLTNGNKIKLWKVQMKNGGLTVNDGNRMGEWEGEKMEGEKLIYGNKDKLLEGTIK